MDQWKKMELAEAASIGIRAYLATTRGANKFGSSTAVSVTPDFAVVVTHGPGEVTKLEFKE